MNSKFMRNGIVMLVLVVGTVALLYLETPANPTNALVDFQAVVPAVAYDISIDVRVRARGALETAVAAAADAVVVHVLQVGKAFVVADDVVAGGVEQRDALRPHRVRRIHRFVPSAAVPLGIMQLAALNNQASHGAAPRQDRHHRAAGRGH